MTRLFSRTTALLLALLLVETTRAAGDPARGADLFQQNCSDCHSRKPGVIRLGPPLFSVVGRPAASIPDYSYSPAMRRSGLVWTPDQLMIYLRARRRYISGVYMSFPGLRYKKDREDVIAFLSTLRPANGGEAQAAAALLSKPTASRSAR
jgi:cytochrome c